MKLSKKTIAILLVAMVALAAFAQGATESAPAKSQLDAAITSVIDEKKPVTIEFWTGTGAANLPYLQNMVDAFMAAYPNITVDFSNQGAIKDLTAKVTQNIVSKTTPAITNLNAPTYPEYIASGALVDLMPYYNNARIGYTDAEKADFFQSYIVGAQAYGGYGTLYAWPTNKKTTNVLVYNKTYFEAHNLAVPTTWDEVVAVAKYIYEDTGKPGFSYDTSYGEDAFKTLSSQWGSPYVTADGKVQIDNEASLAVLKFFKENMDKGYFTLPQLMPSAGGNYSNAGFVMEECYFFVGPAAGITYDIPSPAKGQKDFEVGVAAVPQKDPSNGKTFSKGEDYAVFTNTTEEQRVAAWLLIKFLSAAENNMEWLINTGNLPISNAQVNAPEYQAFLSKENDGSATYYKSLAINAALDMTEIMNLDVAFDMADALASEVGTMWKSVMIGGADPAQSLKDVQKKFN
ncbi:MAG: extracellular solute-binding protein [Sphaerochaetaceae bacterium]|nr:extracellular solute-binding protein [Sphaerochaetaceae bacterium]